MEMFVFACIVVGIIVAHHWHAELTAMCRDCGHSRHNHYLPNHGGVCICGCAPFHQKGY